MYTLFKFPSYRWSAYRRDGWNRVHVVRMGCVSVDHSVGRWFAVKWQGTQESSERAKQFKKGFRFVYIHSLDLVKLG